jgi:ATP-dependent RNA helicase DDX19/DBP5
MATWMLTIHSHAEILKGVYAAGFKKPSKIQEKALPLLLANP